MTYIYGGKGREVAEEDSYKWFLLTIWSLRNYLDIVFTDYGVTSYDIGTGFGHFAIATPDVSVILYSRGIVDATSVLVLRLNYAFL